MSEEIKPAERKARSDIGDLKQGFYRAAGVGLSLFAGWALLVPLDSAIVAPGTLISSGNNKVLQSRAGGTVAAIHARDGDKIRKGQPILDIDAIAEKAELTRLKARQATLRAIMRRLEAEKVHTPGQSQDLSLPSATSPQHDDQLDAEQRREFEKGRLAVAAEIAASRQRVEGLRHRRDGLAGRLPLLQRQLGLLEHQLSSARTLVKGGHIAKQQAWEIEGRVISQSSEVKNVEAELEATLAGIREIEDQIAQITNKDARGTSQQLTDVLGELKQITDQIRAAETGIAEKKIVASEPGTLVRFGVTTLGAVVKPGEMIGEIVPRGAVLEILARVPPKDISTIRRGQPAQVKLHTFASSATPPIEGVVSVVAADSTIDEKTHDRYFEVRVRIIDTPATRHATVGMTGDVYLLGTPRTFAAYLVEPITSSFGKAMREN